MNNKQLKLNTFDYFYKKQIRKDIMDKLNVIYCEDLDLKCSFFFKGYIKFLPSDRNFHTMPVVSVIYQYLLESFFCQKILRKSQIKKVLNQRDIPDTYFHFFICSIRKKEHIFFLLIRLFVIFLSSFNNNMIKKNTSKSKFVFQFTETNIFLKKINVLIAPWMQRFPLINIKNPLIQNMVFKTCNSILFFFVLSRLQMFKYTATSVNLLSHNFSEILKVNRNSISKKILKQKLTKIHKKEPVLVSLLTSKLKKNKK